MRRLCAKLLADQNCRSPITIQGASSVSSSSISMKRSLASSCVRGGCRQGVWTISWLPYCAELPLEMGLSACFPALVWRHAAVVLPLQQNGAGSAKQLEQPSGGRALSQRAQYSTAGGP